MIAPRTKSIARSPTRSLFIALGEAQRLLELFKNCQATNYTIRTQQFTRPYCWPTQAKSTQQRIMSPPRMAEFTLRKEKCSMKQKRESQAHLWLVHNQFYRFQPSSIQRQRQRRRHSSFDLLAILPLLSSPGETSRRGDTYCILRAPSSLAIALVQCAISLAFMLTRLCNLASRNPRS